MNWNTHRAQKSSVKSDSWSDGAGGLEISSLEGGLGLSGLYDILGQWGSVGASGYQKNQCYLYNQKLNINYYYPPYFKAYHCQSEPGVVVSFRSIFFIVL